MGGWEKKELRAERPLGLSWVREHGLDAGGKGKEGRRAGRELYLNPDHLCKRYRSLP